MRAASAETREILSVICSLDYVTPFIAPIERKEREKPMNSGRSKPMHRLALSIAQKKRLAQELAARPEGCVTRTEAAAMARIGVRVMSSRFCRAKIYPVAKSRIAWFDLRQLQESGVLEVR
jgi:hypothetical protein